MYKSYALILNILISYLYYIFFFRQHILTASTCKFCNKHSFYGIAWNHLINYLQTHSLLFVSLVADKDTPIKSLEKESFDIFPDLILIHRLTTTRAPNYKHQNESKPRLCFSFCNKFFDTWAMNPKNLWKTTYRVSFFSGTRLKWPINDTFAIRSIK